METIKLLFIGFLFISILFAGCLNQGVQSPSEEKPVENSEKTTESPAQMQNKDVYCNIEITSYQDGESVKAEIFVKENNIKSIYKTNTKTTKVIVKDEKGKRATYVGGETFNDNECDWIKFVSEDQQVSPISVDPNEYRDYVENPITIRNEQGVYEYKCDYTPIDESEFETKGKVCEYQEWLTKGINYT